MLRKQEADVPNYFKRLVAVEDSRRWESSGLMSTATTGDTSNKMDASSSTMQDVAAASTSTNPADGGSATAASTSVDEVTAMYDALAHHSNALLLQRHIRRGSSMGESPSTRAGGHHHHRPHVASRRQRRQLQASSSWAPQDEDDEDLAALGMDDMDILSKTFQLNEHVTSVTSSVTSPSFGEFFLVLGGGKNSSRYGTTEEDEAVQGTIGLDGKPVESHVEEPESSASSDDDDESEASSPKQFSNKKLVSELVGMVPELVRSVCLHTTELSGGAALFERVPLKPSTTNDVNTSPTAAKHSRCFLNETEGIIAYVWDDMAEARRFVRSAERVWQTITEHRIFGASVPRSFQVRHRGHVVTFTILCPLLLCNEALNNNMNTNAVKSVVDSFNTVLGRSSLFAEPSEVAQLGCDGRVYITAPHLMGIPDPLYTHKKKKEAIDEGNTVGSKCNKVRVLWPNSYSFLFPSGVQQGDSEAEENINAESIVKRMETEVAAEAARLLLAAVGDYASVADAASHRVVRHIAREVGLRMKHLYLLHTIVKAAEMDETENGTKPAADLTPQGRAKLENIKVALHCVECEMVSRALKHLVRGEVSFQIAALRDNDDGVVKRVNVMLIHLEEHPEVWGQLNMQIQRYFTNVPKTFFVKRRGDGAPSAGSQQEDINRDDSFNFADQLGVMKWHLATSLSLVLAEDTSTVSAAKKRRNNHLNNGSGPPAIRNCATKEFVRLEPNALLPLPANDGRVTRSVSPKKPPRDGQPQQQFSMAPLTLSGSQSLSKIEKNSTKRVIKRAWQHCVALLGSPQEEGTTVVTAPIRSEVHTRLLRCYSVVFLLVHRGAMGQVPAIAADAMRRRFINVDAPAVAEALKSASQHSVSALFHAAVVTLEVLALLNATDSTTLSQLSAAGISLKRDAEHVDDTSDEVLEERTSALLTKVLEGLCTAFTHHTDASSEIRNLPSMSIPSGQRVAAWLAVHDLLDVEDSATTSNGKTIATGIYRHVPLVEAMHAWLFPSGGPLPPSTQRRKSIDAVESINSKGTFFAECGVEAPALSCAPSLLRLMRKATRGATILDDASNASVGDRVVILLSATVTWLLQHEHFNRSASGESQLRTILEGLQQKSENTEDGQDGERQERVASSLTLWEAGDVALTKSLRPKWLTLLRRWLAAHDETDRAFSELQVSSRYEARCTMRLSVELETEHAKETAAAVKIQALQRGRMARRTKSSSSQPATASAAQDNRVAMNGEADDDEHEKLTKAATKIQSLQRGRQGRKKAAAVAEDRKKMKDDEQPASPTTGSNATNADDQKAGLTPTAAATKIQAIQRGNTVRKKLGNKKKSSPTSAMPPKSSKAAIAATKIQAVHRGRSVRKNYDKIKIQELERRRQLELQRWRAAVRIQAAERGRVVRREFNRQVYADTEVAQCQRDEMVERRRIYCKGADDSSPSRGAEPAARNALIKQFYKRQQELEAIHRSLQRVRSALGDESPLLSTTSPSTNAHHPNEVTEDSPSRQSIDDTPSNAESDPNLAGPLITVGRVRPASKKQQLTDGVPLVPLAQRRQVSLKSQQPSPYLRTKFPSSKYPFLAVSPPSIHDDTKKKTTTSGPSTASSKQKSNSPQPKLRKTLSPLRSTASTTPSKKKSSSSQAAKLSHTCGGHERSYMREHQISCQICQDTAIQHFIKLEQRLGNTEKKARNTVIDEETDRRRQLYKLYVPMHHRIRQYINEIKAQQQRDYTVEQLTQLLARLQFDEEQDRRRFGADMLRTLRALYRCAQREKVSVVEDLERAAEDERIRLEVQEKQAALQRQSEAVAHHKAIVARMQLLEQTEERKRDEHVNSEFRAWVQLVLRINDGHDKASSETTKRVDQERTGARTALSTVEQGHARENIEGEERLGRAEIRQRFYESIAQVRQKVLRNKLADWEAREAVARRAKSAALMAELLTVQLSAWEKREAFVRRLGVVQREEIAERRVLVAKAMDEMNITFTEDGRIEYPTPPLTADTTTTTTDEKGRLLTDVPLLVSGEGQISTSNDASFFLASDDDVDGGGNTNDQLKFVISSFVVHPRTNSDTINSARIGAVDSEKEEVFDKKGRSLGRKKRFEPDDETKMPSKMILKIEERRETLCDEFISTIIEEALRLDSVGLAHNHSMVIR